MDLPNEHRWYGCCPLSPLLWDRARRPALHVQRRERWTWRQSAESAGAKASHHVSVSTRTACRATHACCVFVGAVGVSSMRVHGMARHGMTLYICMCARMTLYIYMHTCTCASGDDSRFADMNTHVHCTPDMGSRLAVLPDRPA